MSRVDVDDLAVRLELAVEERHELRREPALVEDPVQPLDDPRDLQVAADSHPEAHVDVPDEEGREEAVAGRVGDRGAEAVGGERDEIVEVPPHRLRRCRDRPDLVVPDLRERAREDRLLDPAGLLEKALEPLAPHLRIEDGADDPEGDQEVVRGDARVDVEGEDEGAVAERDRREPRDTEAGLELAVDRGVLQVGEDDSLVESPVDRPVRHRDGEPLGDLSGAPEAALEDVVVVLPSW